MDFLDFSSFLPHIKTGLIIALKAIAIIIAGYYVSKFVRYRIKKYVGKHDEILASFLSQVIFVLSFIVMIVAALGTVGVNTNSIIAVLGTAGVAIALGLKDSLSSVASGIILIVLRPFKKGDLIEFDKFIGSVDSINLFNTTLLLNDGKYAIIPNSNISRANVINVNFNDQRRIELIIGIGYSSDIQLVKELIIDIFNTTPEVDAKQGYFIGLTEFGESALNLTVRFWASNSYGIINTQSKVLESIKIAFDKNNIEIPFNKLDVQILDSKQTKSKKDKQKDKNV